MSASPEAIRNLIPTCVGWRFSQFFEEFTAARSYLIMTTAAAGVDGGIFGRTVSPCC